MTRRWDRLRRRMVCKDSTDHKPYLYETGLGKLVVVTCNCGKVYGLTEVGPRRLMPR